MEFNFHQAKRLLEMFGGEDASVTVSAVTDWGISRLVAFYTEYPEEGSLYLDD